jgi:hypothetical protein
VAKAKDQNTPPPVAADREKIRLLGEAHSPQSRASRLMDSTIRHDLGLDELATSS